MLALPVSVGQLGQRGCFLKEGLIVSTDFTTNTTFSRETRLGVSSSAARTRTEHLPTTSAIEREAEQLALVETSGVLQSWIARYSKVGHRHPYLWKWCRRGVEVTSLSSVDEALWDTTCDTKVLGVMLDVLIDDVADEHGDARLLDALVRLPLDGEVKVDPASFGELADYVQLTLDVWSEIHQRLSLLPRYAEFSDVLQYDYLQLMNTMRYAHLLNRIPCMLNLVEHDLYLPHNMHMMISATIDLMASPGFVLDELGLVREAVWHAQYMGRIGNLVTTWKREITKRDFTSGVFAHALLNGDLRPDDLDELNESTIVTLIEKGGHEDHFLQSWQRHRQCIELLTPRVKSVDLRRLTRGLDKLICLHLASRGKK